MQRSGWARVLVVSAVVGIIALVSNITSVAQLSGEADTWLTIRFTMSRLVNSGTVWAGLLILAGWLVRRPAQAMAAGIVAGVTSLVVHYGLGLLFGMFDGDVWRDNWVWFAAALIFGPPLGLIGAAARRSDLLGLIARLVVPVGAMAEPFVVGMFGRPDFLPAPDRISTTIVGGVLLTAGIGGAILILHRHRTAGPPPGDQSKVAASDSIAL